MRVATFRRREATETRRRGDVTRHRHDITRHFGDGKRHRREFDLRHIASDFLTLRIHAGGRFLASGVASATDFDIGGCRELKSVR